MYWDGAGLVVDDQGDKKLFIDYNTCRNATKMLERGVKGYIICNLYGITREQLGEIYVGYLNKEFSL